MKKRTLVVTALVAVCLALNGCAMQAAPNEAAPETTASPAPEATNKTSNTKPYKDFTVEDASGNPVALSSFIGNGPVVVNFWASWCGPCKMEMPDFAQAAQDYKDKGVTFVMVNLADGQMETKESAQMFLDGEELVFDHVLFDTTGEASGAYNITGIPATLFIDAEGNIVKQQVGSMPGDKLIGVLDSMLE